MGRHVRSCPTETYLYWRLVAEAATVSLREQLLSRHAERTTGCSYHSAFLPHRWPACISSKYVPKKTRNINAATSARDGRRGHWHFKGSTRGWQVATRNN